MGARRAAAASMSTEAAERQPGRPSELARVLRALALRSGRRAAGSPHSRRSRARGSRISASAARPARGRRSSPSWSGQGLGWKVYDEELVEAIAHRMGSPIDEVRALDELAPSMVQDWLLPLREEYYAPQEAYLDHLAKIDRGDRPRRRIDPRRPRGRLHAAARHHAFGPRRSPRSRCAPADGRADGRLTAHRPAGRPRARPPPRRSSTEPCTAPTPTTRTTSTWCSTPTPSDWKSPPRSSWRREGRAARSAGGADASIGLAGESRIRPSPPGSSGSWKTARRLCPASCRLCLRPIPAGISIRTKTTALDQPGLSANTALLIATMLSP